MDGLHEAGELPGIEKNQDFNGGLEDGVLKPHRTVDYSRSVVYPVSFTFHFFPFQHGVNYWGNIYTISDHSSYYYLVTKQDRLSPWQLAKACERQHYSDEKLEDLPLK